MRLISGQERYSGRECYDPSGSFTPADKFLSQAYCCPFEISLRSAERFWPCNLFLNPASCFAPPIYESTGESGEENKNDRASTVVKKVGVHRGGRCSQKHQAADHRHRNPKQTNEPCRFVHVVRVTVADV